LPEGTALDRLLNYCQGAEPYAAMARCLIGKRLGFTSDEIRALAEYSPPE